MSRMRSLPYSLLIVVVFVASLYLLARPNDHRPAHAVGRVGEHVEHVAIRWAARREGVRAAQEVLGVQPEGHRPVRNRHGLVTLDWADAPRTHPITTLIQQAKKTHEDLAYRIRTKVSLQNAVDDYRNLSGGIWDPPRGFDVWYNFAKRHNSVTLPSLIPQATLSVLPFLAYTGASVRQRLAAAHRKSGMYYIKVIDDGGVKKWETGGPEGNSGRLDDMLDLIEEILPLLPPPGANDPPELLFHFSNADGPSYQAHHEVLQGSMDLARQGRTWAPNRLARLEAAQHHTFGWLWQCPPDSALTTLQRDWVLNDDEVEDDSATRRPQFVQDVMASHDYCHNPELMSIHGTLLNDKSRASGDMTPIISTCKTVHNVDILGVPTDAMKQNTPPMSWSEKTIPKALWRGSLTGAFHNSWTPWRRGHRERMVYLTAENNGSQEVLLEKEGGGLIMKEFDVKDMNKRWFDVAPTGGAAQCDPGECEILQAEFQWGGRVNPEEQKKFRYLLDLDGNGWSSRFRRLLTSSTVVIKSTIFPEWFSEMLIPWYHYVPMQVDYSDVYDIMAYFEGSPDGLIRGHERAAEEIALAGRKFTEERWRWVDMQSYMLLMLLEYSRILTDDRDGATFHHE